MNKLVYDNLEINLYDKVLGIRASGGADSTLLLYLLAKYTTNPVTAYVLSTEINNYVEETLLYTIVDKIHKILSKECIKVKPIRVKQKTLEILLDETNKCAEKDNIDILYVGITKAPTSLIDSLPLSEYEKYHRDFNHKSETLYKNTYMPFANIDKSIIAKIYNQEKIIDDIFPLTLSCVIDTDKHCGDCWWCKERMWAFGRLI